MDVVEVRNVKDLALFLLYYEDERIFPNRDKIKCLLDEISNEDIIEMIDNPDDDVCEAAVNVLASRMNKWTSEKLIDAVLSESPGIYEAAVNVLTGRMETLSDAVIIRIIAKTNGMLRRLALAEMIDRMEQWTEGVLMLAIGNPNTNRVAVYELANRMKQWTDKKLIEAVSNDNPGISEAAINALTYIDGKEIDEAIIGAMDSTNDDVRRAVLYALEERNLFNELRKIILE